MADQQADSQQRRLSIVSDDFHGPHVAKPVQLKTIDKGPPTMTDKLNPAANDDLSSVEKAKLASNYLRGSVAEELANTDDHFAKEASLVLKHHGMYQQDDRDLRGKRGPDGKKLDKVYSLMVRTKIPGGKLNSSQLLAELDLCDELGNGTLRITNRQDFQLHGVLKRNVKETIRRINEVQLTTLGGCGDVERNVMCCPAPFHGDGVHDQMQEMASRLSAHLLPRSTAYHEIWLTDPDSGEKQLCGGGAEGHEIEPLYGKSYLPRKFKIAMALPHDNCVDVYTPDLGLLAIIASGKIVGYNFLVGGSFGVTPSDKKTFPALGRRMAFVPVERVIDVATAVIQVQRDFGNRTNRNLARLKYLIADWGVEKFKAQVERYCGHPLADPHPDDVRGFDDHIGWHEQGDGRLFYGLNVENGRILDREGLMLKTALREICHTYRPGIRLTPHQSILLAGIDPRDRGEIEGVLRRHGVRLHDEISNARRWSMACVGLPTCPLTITESERVLPGVIDRLEVELSRLELASERFTIRMTGCPNGCARPYNADVGLSGRAVGKYAVYLGGRLLGDRLGFLYQDHVPLDEIVPLLTVLLTYFKHERQPGETFGDFCFRKGAADLSHQAKRATA